MPVKGTEGGAIEQVDEAVADVAVVLGGKGRTLMSQGR